VIAACAGHVEKLQKENETGRFDWRFDPELSFSPVTLLFSVLHRRFAYSFPSC
jgi:hypothetical protein